MIKEIFPIPAFRDNYIWAFHDPVAGTACVVDPGDAGPVLAWLARMELHLTHILVTHHHPDHTGGLPALVEACAPRVLGPANSPINGIDQGLQDGDRVTVLGVLFEVLTVPGHTLDHIAFYAPAPGDQPVPALFCGDTLFAAGCGRIFEGDPRMMYRSLQKLAQLDHHSRVFCTHEYTLANLRFAAAVEPGNPAISRRLAEVSAGRSANRPSLPSTIAQELLTNPFLRCTEPEPRQSAESRSGRVLHEESAVFAELRSWKDSF